MEQIQGLSRSVDGFVLAASRLADQDLRDVAERHQVVLLNRELEGLSSVTLDTASGCRQILAHLASLGHEELTFCAGPPVSWMGAARWAALCSGAEEHGLRVRRVGPYTPTVANGGAAADGALRAGTTALVAHNDLLGIGIMRRLAQRGVRVPEDVSVIGFDNIFAAEFVHPGLTTLGGPGADAGRTGCRPAGHRDRPPPDALGGHRAGARAGPAAHRAGAARLLGPRPGPSGGDRATRARAPPGVRRVGGRRHRVLGHRDAAHHPGSGGAPGLRPPRRDTGSAVHGAARPDHGLPGPQPPRGCAGRPMGAPQDDGPGLRPGLGWSARGRPGPRPPVSAGGQGAGRGGRRGGAGQRPHPGAPVVRLRGRCR